jgi:16S rRNA (uracil1498-N3)-methyltransferase
VIFFYHPLAKEKVVLLENSFFNRIIKVRRIKLNEKIILRNLKSNFEYIYSVEKINKYSAEILLENKNEIYNLKSKVTLYWGICKLKTIYETLPFLNQLGVKNIVFVKCERSQGNIKISYEKINQILINSCEQCGRNNLINFDIQDFYKVIKNFNGIVFDFTNKKLSSDDIKNNQSFFIGPEGGFSESEKLFFKKDLVRNFNTSLVLKSETACITTLSLCL